MKTKTQNEIIKMGYSENEALTLVEKFWNQVNYLKTARQKALYMTA